MIKVLEIKNFKSIRHLKIDCKRINIFIGEPNTGKSNILETLGLFSFGHYSRLRNRGREFVRYDTATNLFYDEDVDQDLEIRRDDWVLSLRFKDGNVQGDISDPNAKLVDLMDDGVDLRASARNADALSSVKYYRFKVAETFERRDTDFLLPPSGENLMSLLRANKELRALANQPFLNLGLRLGLRPQEHKIEVIKEYEDIIVSYPYHLASETLQRLVFYLAAIIPSKQSTLIFEEPESHAFPYYTKYLAEIIALDENENQYFISTHNPYFLEPLVEKASIDDIAVFVTYFEDYETKVKLLSRSDLQKITDMDIFSNIDMFLEAS